MAGVIAGQPLDTLRIRLQQRECQSRSILGVWRGMAGAEGVRGLFRGLSYPFYTTALVRVGACAPLTLRSCRWAGGVGLLAPAPAGSAHRDFALARSSAAKRGDISSATRGRARAGGGGRAQRHAHNLCSRHVCR